MCFLHAPQKADFKFHAAIFFLVQNKRHSRGKLKSYLLHYPHQRKKIWYKRKIRFPYSLFIWMSQVFSAKKGMLRKEPWSLALTESGMFVPIHYCYTVTRFMCSPCLRKKYVSTLYFVTIFSKVNCMVSVLTTNS